MPKLEIIITKQCGAYIGEIEIEKQEFSKLIFKTLEQGLNWEVINYHKLGKDMWEISGIDAKYRIIIALSQGKEIKFLHQSFKLKNIEDNPINVLQEIYNVLKNEFNFKKNSRFIIAIRNNYLEIEIEGFSTVQLN